MLDVDEGLTIFEGDWIIVPVSITPEDTEAQVSAVLML
jgi:hypothetical protein